MFVCERGKVCKYMYVGVRVCVCACVRVCVYLCVFVCEYVVEDWANI